MRTSWHYQRVAKLFIAAHVVILCVALAVTASGHDWFVATNGNDTNDGSTAHPFASPQKALDLAQPGDRIVVRRGVYQGRIVVTRGGLAGQPIIFSGEEGAVLDGGDRFAGWVAAPEAGPGVFCNGSIAYAARAVSWKNRTILDIGGGYTYSDDVAKEILRKLPSDPYWNGVEAHYVVLDGVSYIRFRNGEDPNQEDLAFAPADSAVVRLDRTNHVVVRGFEIRNAYWGVALTGASDCTVERCFVRATGKAAIMLESGASRNCIRDNELTQDYIFPDFGHPWQAPLHHHIWTVWKDLCQGDRMGIRLHNEFGDDNEILSNHVFRCFDGIVAKKGGRGTRIHHNIIENIADDGLALDGTEICSQWHDNLVVEGGNCGIVVDGYAHTQGPIWIYRNRVYHTQADNPGDGIHFKNAFPTEVQVFVYHNSFSANGPSVSANDWTAAGSSLPGVSEARHLYFLNNIFSSKQFYRGWPNWPEKGIGRYASNWVGGDNAGEWRGRGFFADSNIVAEGRAMWPPGTDPSVLEPSDRGNLPQGIDLSRPFMVLGEEFTPLPGYSPELTGKPPDIGAVTGDHPPLQPPIGLAAVRSGAAVELSWEDRSTGENAFLVERSLDGTVFTTIGRTSADATGFIDHDPAPACSYRVRAADFRTAWLSAFSNHVRLPD